VSRIARHIIRICKVRLRIIEAGSSRKDDARCIAIIEHHTRHMEAYRNANESDLRKYALKHHEDLTYLIPGNTPQGEAMLNMLNELIQTTPAHA